MPYRYEWQQFHGQSLADLQPGGLTSRDAIYSMLSEANTYSCITNSFRRAVPELGTRRSIYTLVAWQR